MERKTRNNKGQFSTVQPAEDDIVGSIIQIDNQVNKIINYIWLILKVAIIFVLLFPFIDKIRQKNYLEKFSGYVNDFDFGCKQCTCPDNFHNSTSFAGGIPNKNSGF